MRKLILILTTNLVSAHTYTPVVVKQNNLMNLTIAVGSLLQSACFYFGIGMCLVSVYRYAEYRTAKGNDRLTNIVTLTFLGICVAALSYLPHDFEAFSRLIKLSASLV